MKKRIMCCWIVIAMIISFIPIIALADNVYYVKNESDLRAIANNLDGDYVLTNDIAINGDWNPIGNRSEPFTGTLDGQGHTISGLTVTDSKLKYVGLFGYISSADIKDLEIVGCNISTRETGSGYYIGAIAGYSYGSTISDCAITGDVNIYLFSSQYLWGIPFTMTDAYGGSIVGYNDEGTVERCNVYADIYVYSAYYAAYAGGIVGVNGSYGKLSECQFQGSVSCFTYTAVTDGGSGGMASHNYGVISNCCVKSFVSTKGNYVNSGGIVSRNHGTASNNFYCGFVQNTTIMSLFPDKNSGNIASENFGKLENNYYAIVPSETNEGTGNDSGDGTIAVPKNIAGNESTYPSFDFSSIWRIYEDGLPGLRNVKYIAIPTKGATNSTSSNAPVITSAIAGVNDSTYNLFQDKLNINGDSEETVSIEGTVDPNGCEDVHLYITQGADTAIEVPLDACKDIQIGKEFSPGKPIYMTAIDRKTRKSTSKRTKLSVVGDKMFEGKLSPGMIKLFEDFGVNIPDEVPVLGGQTFGFSLGSISSEVEVDGNEFKISLGTDFFKGKEDSNGKWKKEDWQGFKEGFKDAKNAIQHNISANKYLEKIAPKRTELEMKRGLGGNANVTGYLEGYLDDSGMHLTEGGIVLLAEIKYKYQAMTLVVVVPVYYEIGVGGELKFVGGVKDLVPESGLQKAFTGSITPASTFEIGGGVGVPIVFTAGISGKIKTELEIALNKVYQKLDITGTAKFKLEGPLGLPTYEKQFAKGTFHIYETGNKNTLLGKKFNLYSLSSNELYPAFDIDAPLTITPHDDSTQIWLGDEANIRLMADYTNQEVKTLEEDSYASAAPVLANMDGKNVIAWITDNKERPDGNKPMLVYSVEDNGSWSAPVAVYDDGMADASPKMKDGYIVWQKVDGNITDGMTTREMSEKCEIYIAKWNGSGFDAPVRVTENSVVDQAPTLAVNDGSASVVWIQNSENDFTGLTGENRIMSYTDGGTKTEAALNDAVTWLDTAYIDGKLNIAYETDADADFNTLEDREIYTCVGGAKNQITNNGIVDTHPTYGEFEGNTALYYYSDGHIIYLNNGAEETVTSSAATDQFTVVSNGNNQAVLWTAVNDGSAEIHGALYENGKWSEDVQISDIGQRVKFPSAVMQEDGSIFAAFNRTEKVSDGADYYEDGQSDLCTIRVVPSYDLELTDAYIDEDTMTVYATVTNSGELAVDSYTVTITDNGANSEKTITEPLKAGESAEVEIAYNKPEGMIEHDFEIAVTTTAGDEYNTQNNAVTLSVGHADIEVDNVAVNAEENKITADISNTGYTDAQSVTVRLRENSADGAVLGEQVISAAVNEAQSVEFDFDKSAMRFYNSSKQLYITAEYDGEEASIGNNDGYAVITSPSGAADYQTELLSYDKIDGRYTINSVAVNNTDTELTCQLYTAVYSADGVLKGCGAVGAVIDANDDTGVDISVPCEIESGDTIKAFMWKNQEPLSNTAEMTVE